MKLFCGCKSKWERQGNDDKLCWLFEKGYLGVNEQGIPTYDKTKIDSCNKCNLIKWYNADYENMMFDLRRMNEC